MKKAEEYIEELGRDVYMPDGSLPDRLVSIHKAKIAIKNAQTDAIDATVKMCAGEVSTRKFKDGNVEYIVKYKHSILRVADKLKKELNGI